VDEATATVAAAGVTAFASVVTSISVALITSRTKRFKKPITVAVTDDRRERRRFIIRRTIIGFLYSFGGLSVWVGFYWIYLVVVYGFPLERIMMISGAILYLSVGALFISIAYLTQKWWPRVPQSN
jgi:hypothetical protein